MSNILGTLGLCRKAGKLVFGFDSVAAEIKKPDSKVSGVILAADLSEKTVKEVSFICNKFSVPLCRCTETLSDFERVMGKRTGIIAVLDRGLYKSLIKNSNKLGDTE